MNNHLSTILNIRPGILFLLVCGFLASCSAPDSKKVSLSLAETAAAFLKTLREPQRGKAVFPFDSAERYNWNFVPIDRNGLAVRDMDSTQREAAFALLRQTLSEQGYRKARAIMELDAVLKVLENRAPDDDYRHPEKYYFSIFGEPEADAPWGWRVEGHHLSINYTSTGDTLVSSTPEFMGANPAIVPSGPQKGKEVLREESRLGFMLLHALDPGQLDEAVISEDAPDDIITGNKRKALLEHPEGVLFGQLTDEQKTIFMQLLHTYTGNFKETFSEGLMKKLEDAGMDSLRFAWAGSQQPGPGNRHYYRIHGPVLLIEYDNTQNNANHVHTVVRDLTNDFGEDALKRHYQQGHSHSHAHAGKQAPADEHTH